MNIEEKDKLCQEIKEIIQSEKYLYRINTDDELLEAVREEVFNRVKQYKLSINGKRELVDIIYKQLKDIDILKPLLLDNTISKIMINGIDSIYVEKNKETIKLEKTFGNQCVLDNLIERILKENNIEKDEKLIINSELKNNDTIKIIFPPIAINGPVVVINKDDKKEYTFNELIENKTISSEDAKIIKDKINNKDNIFICGIGNSGKTTLLNALLELIPKEDRIIIIENNNEINVANCDNVVRLEAKDSGVSLGELINVALQMDGDRIIIDEIQGSEIIELIQGINNGSDGVITTIRSNSVSDMIRKVEQEMIKDSSYSSEMIKEEIKSAMEVVVQLGKEKREEGRSMSIRLLK